MIPPLIPLLIPPWVLGAGSLLACVTLGRPALAQEAWLEWTAPPECQNTSEVERRLQSLLGRPVDFEVIPSTRVQMAWRAETGWAVRVTVALPSGPRDRALDAPSCADALDVVALSLALILEPDFVPAEPAALRGFRINGKPTRSANSQASSAESTGADWAQGTPAWRRASFIAGLSRQSQVVKTVVPGMPQASRTLAAGITWASMVASSRSTQLRAWQRRTA